MNIGVLTSGFYPDKLDARNRSVWEINLRLKKRGHRVSIITRNYKPPYEIEGIKVYGLTSLSPVGFFSDARNIIVKLNVDLCHFYGSLSGAILFSRLFHDLDIPAVVTIYDNPLTIRDLLNLRASDLRWGLFGTLHSLLNSTIPSCLIECHLKELDRIILLGEDRRLDLGLLANKLTIIPHGVDFCRFARYDPKHAEHLKSSIGFSKDAKVVLYFGHCHPSRGLEDIVTSFCIIKEEMPKAKLLLVVPPSSYLGYIKKMIEKHKLTDCIKIVSRWVGNPEHYLWSSSVIIVPYRFKNFVRIPFILLEAMAAGKPVVVTDVVCSSFNIKNEMDGLVVRARQKNDLASAVLKFLLSESLSKTCGSNAQAKVKFLDWEVVVEKIENIYLEVSKANDEKRKIGQSNI